MADKKLGDFSDLRDLVDDLNVMRHRIRAAEDAAETKGSLQWDLTDAEKYAIIKRKTRGGQGAASFIHQDNQGEKEMNGTRKQDPNTGECRCSLAARRRNGTGRFKGQTICTWCRGTITEGERR